MNTTSYSYRLLIRAILLSVSLSACGNPETELPDVETGWVQIELDQGNDRELLAFYIGGMADPNGADAFAERLVMGRDGNFYLDLPEVISRIPALKESLEGAAEDSRIDWEEFEPIISRYYYTYRPIPETIEELKSRYGDWRDPTSWFGFRVNGVMSPNVRYIRVSIQNLTEAISSYNANERRMMYPVGTTFISEDVENDEIIELSAMTKRADGFWDFFAYGTDGRLVTVLERTPTNLTVPTRCVGCHFGNRLFEPEKSFPVVPSPGPTGPRELYVGSSMKRSETIARLDEHRKRSDSILGLYATLFISEMQSRREQGLLEPEEEEFLSKAGF
jgi:hypothetical protein